MLGQEGEWQLTNRELAQRLGVDPGHLHFHVRMLLRAGLIDLADGGKGREKPYRAVARTVRVAPELVSTGLGTDVRASMLDDLQRAWDAFGASGDFRITQTTVRIPAERALRLIEESAAANPRRAASACRTSAVSATGMSSRYSSRCSNDWSTASMARV